MSEIDKFKSVHKKSYITYVLNVFFYNFRFLFNRFRVDWLLATINIQTFTLIVFLMSYGNYKTNEKSFASLKHTLLNAYSAK